VKEHAEFTSTGNFLTETKTPRKKQKTNQDYIKITTKKLTYLSNGEVLLDILSLMTERNQSKDYLLHT
jgi:hypothetical protein